MGTIIKEVAFLDLTEASEETMEEIKAIHNVAFMVYNEKFERFMPKISFSEIASSIKVQGKFTLINSKLEIDKKFAAGMEEPIFFLVNGKMVVKPDVTADMIDQAISGLLVNGTVYCPERTQAALQQKINQDNGKMIAYLDDALLETDKLTLNNDYLRQLKPKTDLAIGGAVNMLEELDPSLLDEKINRLQLLKGAVVLESNRDLLGQKLVGNRSNITTVPAGYTYITRDLQLDSGELARYELAKLYVTGSVYVNEEVTKEEIRNHIADIKTEKAIYCRSELKSEILQKCDPSVEVIAYSGTLRVVDGEYKLTHPELEYTENKMTLIIHGVMEIDKNVDPKVLYEKLDRVDLYGVVSGNTEQCGVLQTKLKVKKGVVDNEEEKEVKKPDDNEDSNDTYISNVSLLRL
ncbi:MAG TPA: hypothetical protein VFK33_00315 [Bacillales bacterium]|nr:hypothetical protein [Bacillales bacterium]